MKNLLPVAGVISLLTLGACQTTSLNDFPEMTDAEFANVTNLPELEPELEGLKTKRTFYSRVGLLKKRGKKLYGAWTDSTASACTKISSNAYISAKNEESSKLKTDPCPEGTSGYGEDVIRVKTEDDSDDFIDLLIEVF